MSKLNCPHCGAHIDEHPASRCLDAWAAKVVMGKRIEFRKGEPVGWKEDGEPFLWFPNDFVDLDDNTLYIHATDGYTGMVQHYSKYIAAAWQVEEKMRESGWEFVYDDDSEGKVAMFSRGRDQWGEIDVHSAMADTAPLAICKAALLAAIKVTQRV